MERMQYPPMDVISKLGERNKSCIQLGEVDVALISLLEAVHSMKRLFVDVKPDNFMVCKQSRKCLAIAQRLTMIDLGLVESFHDMASSGHSQNMYPNGQVVGTPNYVSINVLEGNTPSRRDDLEALGYVIVELILFAYKHHGMLEPSTSRNGKKSTGLDSLLPWSACKSDEEILRLKKESMDESLFSMMENDTNQLASKIMRKYFDDVRGLAYKEKPNYTRLKSFLQDLKINITSSSSSNTERSKKKSRNATKSKTSRNVEEVLSDSSTSQTGENECVKQTSYVHPSSPPKTRRTTNRTRTTAKPTKKSEVPTKSESSNDSSVQSYSPPNTRQTRNQARNTVKPTKKSEVSTKSESSDDSVQSYSPPNTRRSRNQARNTVKPTKKSEVSTKSDSSDDSSVQSYSPPISRRPSNRTRKTAKPTKKSEASTKSESSDESVVVQRDSSICKIDGNDVGLPTPPKKNKTITENYEEFCSPKRQWHIFCPHPTFRT